MSVFNVGAGKPYKLSNAHVKVGQLYYKFNKEWAYGIYKKLKRESANPADVAGLRERFNAAMRRKKDETLALFVTFGDEEDLAAAWDYVVQRAMTEAKRSASVAAKKAAAAA
jgi:hypothetical protein